MNKLRSPKFIALAVKLYDKFHSTQKVARRLEIGVSTAHRVLKAAGVVMPGRFDPIVQERKRALTGAREQAAARDYASGMRMADLRRKYGVGQWAILSAVKRCNVKERPRGQQVRRFSNNEQREIRRLYVSGWTQSQIAVQLSSSQAVIGRVLTSLGVATRGRAARGSQHGSWKGGRVRIGEYIGVLVEKDDPLHCMVHQSGYVLEHRLVMARALGRPLTASETVHHLDGNKTNNAIANLQLRFGRHGKGVVLKCRCCGSTDIVPEEL